MKNTLYSMCSVLVIGATAGVGAYVSGVSEAYAYERVTSIEIEGARRIEEQTIRTYMNVRIGDELTNESMNDALKSLYATGLFVDVKVRRSKAGTMLVSVIENPIINEIAFEGNDELEDSQLAAEIQLRSRQVFTRTKVQADVARLYQLYQRQGRFSVTIEPKVIKLDQNRVNLVFEILEGEVTEVRSIRFVGNKRFDDDALRGEISTKESRWYRFLSNDDRYDPDRLAYDKELLRRFYLKNGYADFNVKSATAELSPDKDDFYVTFTIDEGVRYKIGEINFNSRLYNFDPSVLYEHVDFKSGDWYDADQVQSTVDRISDALGDMQFAFVRVRPNIDRKRIDRVLDLTFEIEETPRVYVERIDIHGNVRTQDKVVRRELMLVEGDPFNRSKVARSEQAIRDLGYFENVEFQTLPGSAPDKTVIDVTVTEKSTGELSIGAGFSTTDGPLADLRIREKNFLGKGQDVLLATTIAGERTQFDFSFTEPFFMDRDISAGVDLFHVTTDYQDESSYDQKRTGGSLRLGYPLSERWRQSLRYSYTQADIFDVDSDASLFIQQQEGERTTSAVAQRITYDSRDSTLFPTEGYNLWFDTEVAGLGGDAEYISGKVGGSYYYPVATNWILNVLGETGAIGSYSDEDVQINERFFLGGNTLRGFERSGVGPRDTATDDALGGNYFYRSSVELTMPVGLPEELGVKGHVFNDLGALWGIDGTYNSGVEEDHYLRASAGVGLSWRSPFGPIRMDLAAPYLEEDYDVDEIFRFSFGTRF